MVEPQGPEISPRAIELTDKDIFDAMKSIPGYLDITPGDFREVYKHAFKFAVERIFSSIPASCIMSTNVISVRPDTPLPEVADLMGARRIAGVPVTDDDQKVVGVISEKDFLKSMGAGSHDNFMTVVANCLHARGCVVLPIRAKNAEDIMTSPAITLPQTASLKEIMETLVEKGINRAPITSPEGRLVGIVTRNDLLAASARNIQCS